MDTWCYFCHSRILYYREQLFCTMVLIAGNRPRWAAEWKTCIFTTLTACSLLEGAHKTPTAFYKKMHGKETRDFSQNAKNNNYTNIAKLSVPSSLQYEWINVYVQLSCRNCFSVSSVCCSVAVWTAAFIAKGTEQKKTMICVKKNPESILVQISKTFQFIGKTVWSADLRRSAPYQLGNLNILKTLAFEFTALILKVICIYSVKLNKISIMWWMMETVWTAVWTVAPLLL